ncbi:uncharacterized protein LOC130997994 [Salvia miltiorrhiza]|uniref:uncharacterized protein LOC130997994 n=1 Tax=Salvia miltiorrhiza TaxID=226208 RepID=UPI0025ABE9E5|nr:uncharacterized protein LOC130997994 [Salvia miltiorrhiza]
MFPIAWAACEVENEEYWSWFMKLLLHDLEVGDGSDYTFISDQQKGLENAVKEIAPNAEHRNCSRHIYMNWKKSHKGGTLKNIFLRACRSIYVEKYNTHLLEMKRESIDAFEDFVSRDTSRFCKAFISTTMKSDMIDNNISETFNGYILNARGKHVIHMLEEIRSNLMVRQVKKRDQMLSVTDTICPNIRKKLEKHRQKISDCVARPSLDSKFEVSHFEDRYYGFMNFSLQFLNLLNIEFFVYRFVVDINANSCTCRYWDLTGIPCIHAVSALHWMGRDPVEMVHDYYSVSRFLKAYESGLVPIRGESMWPEVEGFKVKPPAVRRMPGRPKKKRIRSANEREGRNPTQLSRGGMIMTCRRCGDAGHNKRNCQNMFLDKPPAPKNKVGRPRKVREEGTPSTSTSTTPNTSTTTTGRGAGRAGRSTGRGGGRAGRSSGRGGGNDVFFKERNFARAGAGLYISERTRNQYLSAPNSRDVRVIQTRSKASIPSTDIQP